MSGYYEYQDYIQKETGIKIASPSPKISKRKFISN